MKEEVISTLEEIVAEINRDIADMEKQRSKIEEYEEYVFYSERILGLQLAKSKIWKRVLQLKKEEE